MDIQKAVERIYWRFGGNENPKPFPINEADIQAYNAIKSYISNVKENAVQSNQGFAKLYIWAYSYLLEEYKASVFDEIPQKQLHKMIDQPLSYFIQKFTDKLNESEMYELLEDIKHPAMYSEGEREKAVQALTEKLKKPENMDKLTGQVWEYETVENNLLSQITSAIVKFNK